MSYRYSLVMDDSALTLAERFRRACKIRGVTFRSLEGDYPKLPYGYASFIATGRRTNLSPEMVDRVSTLLGVSVGWLINGAGPMFVEDERSRTGARGRDNRAKAEEILRLEGEYPNDEIAAASDRAAETTTAGRSVRAWRDEIELEIRVERRAVQAAEAEVRRTRRRGAPIARA